MKWLRPPDVTTATRAELIGTGLGNLTTVNLTTVGSSDWAHWPEFTEKLTGNAQISNYSVVSTGTVASYTNAPLTLSWSDGNPTTSGHATSGAFIAGVYYLRGIGNDNCTLGVAQELRKLSARYEHVFDSAPNFATLWTTHHSHFPN